MRIYMALNMQEELKAAEQAFDATYDADKRDALCEMSRQMFDNLTPQELEEMVQDYALLSNTPTALSA